MHGLQANQIAKHLQQLADMAARAATVQARNPKQYKEPLERMLRVQQVAFDRRFFRGRPG